MSKNYFSFFSEEVKLNREREREREQGIISKVGALNFN